MENAFTVQRVLERHENILSDWRRHWCNNTVQCSFVSVFSVIMDTLVIPLQERVEDWKRAVLQLDKDHAKGMGTPVQLD